MSDKECKKGTIQILEDITVKESSICNSNSPQPSFRRPKPVQNRDKENVSNTADYTNNSRKHSITYFSDEEPVFSDSEEEQEYTRRLLDSQNITYAPSNQLKKNSVEVQCELASYDQEMLEFAARCAKFSVDEAPEEFRELIQLCKHFSWKYRCDKTESAIENLSKSTYLSESRKSLDVTKVSPEFTPSKQGSEDFQSESMEDKIRVNVCGITENLSTRKGFKINNKIIKGAQAIRQSSRLRKLSDKNVAVRKEELSEKVDEIDLKKERNNIKNNNHYESNKKRKRNKQSVEQIMRKFLYNSRKRKRKDSDQEVNDTHVRICLPRHVVRPLARNWMKPHKNTINYHYLNYSDPKFSLLRGPKIRMLYSPTHWLQSIGRVSSKRNKNKIQMV